MKKKILHIALPHGGGGVEVYVRSLLKNTYDRVENILICASDFSKSEVIGANKIYRLDVPREISLGKDIKGEGFIRKIIKSEKPDVIYCHSSMAGAIGRTAALFTKIPVMYNPHGWNFDIVSMSKFKRLIYRIIEKGLSGFTDKIICISDYEKNVALKNNIAGEKKLRVIKNGIEIKAFDDIKKSDKNSLVIGCAARISRQKNPLLFAEVMRIVSEKLPHARFMWIGDGEMREELENALKENGISDLTEITGWVENPHSYIKETDIGVLLSSWEGFGLAVLDFLIMGKPVVATKVGGIPEIVDDKVGCVVKSETASEIAEKIIEIIEKAKNESFSDECIKRAKAFDIKSVSEATVKLYDELTVRKKG